MPLSHFRTLFLQLCDGTGTQCRRWSSQDQNNDGRQSLKRKNIRKLSEKLGCYGRVVSASACQAGGLWFKSGILPLLKHACGESDRLLCWLYTPAEVSPQRWISGNIYHICLHKVWIRQNPLWLWNPEEDITRSPKQGYQWPQKWTCVQQIFFLKKRKEKKNCLKRYKLSKTYTISAKDSPLVYSTSRIYKATSYTTAAPYLPWTSTITSVEYLQMFYPNSFDCLGSLKGKYGIKLDASMLPLWHIRRKVPINSKEDIDKELDYSLQIEPTP